MPFEEKRSALLNLLPENFRTDMFTKIPELQDSIPVDAPPDWQDVTFDRLRLRVQTQAQQISQWSELYRKKEKPINNLNLETNQWAHSETALSENADQEDLLLAGKKGRIKGKGRGGKGPLPCANCGAAGHKAEQAHNRRSPGPNAPATLVAKPVTCLFSVHVEAKGQTSSRNRERNQYQSSTSCSSDPWGRDLER